MDNSQTSDIFLESSMTESSPLCDNESYDCILIRTKKFFSTRTVLNEPTFSPNFLSSLEDCYNCISQCLETIVSLLGSGGTQLSEISIFIGDAISLLQMLSNFIKNIIEALVMTCSVLSSFPTTAGKIILTVFMHCKDSESVYGIHLNSVEKQLKELFRSCHELQLIYLMSLEKHFIFDMSDKEDQSILLAALDINLKIGEIVQALDVKTMAEQWKAYTAVCEKYSNGLIDKNVYNNCTECLSTMVEENIKNAFENEDQDKVVLRSLKVASFTLKIILKVSNVFKHEPNNNYECLLQMLINIYMCEGSILEMMSKKSPQLISQVNLLVLNTTQILLSQLLLNDRFFNCLIRYDIRNVKGDKKLGYVLLLMSTIRCILKISDEQAITLSKSTLVNCVLNTLPHLHVYFYLGLRFKLNDSEDSCGFEQHLFMHLVALCMTLNSEEFAIVERRLYESILEIDYSDALFSSKLWVLLSRVTSRQYTLSCITSLCKTYEKLEKNTLFHISPQQIHLPETIAGIFENLPNEDKVMLCKQLGIQSESRCNLLSILKIRNLPMNLRMTIEDSIIEKLLLSLNKLNNANLNEVQDMKRMTDLIYIASTCSFVEANFHFEECITKAWLKACPRNLFEFPTNIDPGIHWYYTFVRALISLTDATIENFNNFDNVLKIHNVLSNIILTRNNELTLSAIALYCKLSFDLFADIQNSELDSTINETYRNLLLETEPLIKQYVLSKLFTYRERRKFQTVMLKMITERLDLREIWECMSIENHINPNEESRYCIKATAYNSFIHKCVQNKHNYDDCSTLKKKKSQSNFEMDIDDLFESESDSDEPASKKAKVDCGADIVKRLEVDSLLLSQCDVSDECKKRIAVVCDRLRNVIRD